MSRSVYASDPALWEEHLHRLRTTGFRKLRPDHIHMRCPGCGRKQSNARRHTEYDPPHAALIEVLCDKCGHGCKDEQPDYFTAKGKMIDYWKWSDRRDREVRRGAGGTEGAKP